MKKASFKYLFFGGIAGWLMGYVIGFMSNGWYFFNRPTLILYAVIGAIFGALLYNGIMMVEGYSNRFRYTFTGALLGIILVCVGGFIRVGSLDLSRMTFQNALIFEWALIHCGIIIGIIGFLLGGRADRRLRHSRS